MDKLKDRILTEGVTVGSDRINVDGFINHRIDTSFMDEIGEEFARRFAGVKVDKILTVEASGIAIAVSAARYFGYCPVVFAKKAKPNTMTEGVFTAPCMSFTKQTMNEITVAKKHLIPGENILIIDDFLAHGEASKALASIVEDLGYRVESLASVAEMDNGRITFAE